MPSVLKASADTPSHSPSCSHISSLPTNTPYQTLFNLPENTFQIDLKDLRNRFLQTQRIMHPDAWSSKPEKEKAAAAEYSSLLNKAYETLRSPLKRAEYLLSLRDIELGERDKLEDRKVEFAETVQEVEAVMERNRAGINNALSSFEQAYNRGDYEAAKEACVKLKYWVGVEESAQAKLREM
ncbi:iron-sulfur cluster co-chaperone protein HscB, mitochondrial [Ceratobasidium sp. AG-Ba]|nr:iron-sulfur cluster co-chaperone protein HscB, mitochondrial [Ceratobasidium sp. AG-Ba]